jgi:hypothetical protein
MSSGGPEGLISPDTDIRIGDRPDSTAIVESDNPHQVMILAVVYNGESPALAVWAGDRD